MNWDKALDALVNKLHIAIGCCVQSAVIVYHFRSGHDLGPGVTNSLYAFYAFLLGHAATYQRWPDKE